ncbi:MAG: leucine-rich repeat domain-containing protein [Clostridia bacterium]|nr:leucine-rich repeat domain-containing protein [Clostridia bacterium]
MKKKISILLGILLVIALCSVISTYSAFAADTVASGYCGGEGDGTNLTWTLDSDGVLTISGTGSMTDYAIGSIPWLNYRTDITSIEISEGVTVIGSYAFARCTNVESASLPKSLTTVDRNAFYNCNSLATVVYYGSELMTEDISIAENNEPLLNATWICVGFADIIASGSCGNNVIWTLYADGLLVIKGNGSMANYNSSNCPWFSNRSQIRSITIEDGVTYIGMHAFRACSNLSSITIPESLTSIGDYAFYDCSKLISITLPEGLASIGNYAFSWCTSLSRITIPECVTHIGNSAFEGCISLLSITIPNSVTGVGNGAFRACSNLTTITIPEGVTSIGEYAFQDCQGLTSISIPDGVKVIDISTFEGCSSLVSIKIPESVTSIRDHAFYGCSSLVSITIPECITSIGDYVFQDCSNLQSITIPDSVTSIENGVFYGCSRLTSITIPGGMTSIGDFAFFGCGRLKDVYYSGTEDEWGSISICSNNTSLIYYATIHYNYVYLVSSGLLGEVLVWNRYSDGTLVISGTGTMPVFVDANSAPWDKHIGRLSSVVIEEGVLNVSSGAFDGFSNLTSVTIADSVVSIGDYAFSSCEQLASIDLGLGVETIGEAAFFGCSGLTSIYIPTSVSEIEDDAFGACNQLTTVYYCGTESDWSQISIADGNETITNAVKHFGHNLVQHEAKQATCTEVGWEAYENCTHCNYTTYVEIPSPGQHTQAEPVIENYVEPYTSDGGYDLVTYCTVCGEEVYREHIVLPAIYIAAGVCGAQGDNLTWTLGNDGALTISGEGAMADYSYWHIGNNQFSCNSPWYEYRNTINTIVLSDGLTTVGKNAFRDCLFSSIVIPNGLKEIGEESFAGCTSLTSIVIPDGIEQIGVSAFSGCTSLSTVSIGNGIVTLNEWIFCDCTSLGSIVIPESVQTINSPCFPGCVNLHEITVPCSTEWSAGGDVTLTTLHLTRGTGVMPDYDISVYSTPWYNSKSSLTTIIFDEGITNIGDNAFSRCTELSSVSIPDSVVSIGTWAFSSCASLTSISIPEDIISIGNQAFWACTSLTSVVIPEKIETIGAGAFGDCCGLTYIEYNAKSAVFINGNGAFGNVGIEGPGVAVVIGNHVEYIPSYFVSGNIKTVNIGSSVKSIGNSAFMGCYSLTSINIPAGITSIGEFAFADCSSLTSILLPSGVNSLGDYAFIRCGELKRIYIPDTVINIGHGAFNECYSPLTVEYEGTGCQWNQINGNNTIDLYSNNLIFLKGDHQWEATDYSWSSDNSTVTASRQCHYCSTSESETANTISSSTATCTADGVVTYTASFTNEVFETQTKQVDAPALGHDWAAPTYTWADDNSSVTAARICRHDATHVDSETVDTEYAVVTPATETEAGTGIYTAAFTSDAFETQTKDIVLQPTGYALSYSWAEDNKTVTGTAVPYAQGAATITETVSATYEVTTAPTCTTEGAGLWTSAAFESALFTIQTKPVVIAALGHDFLHHDAQAPTCTAIGWDAYDTCSRCDYSTYVELPALGHTPGTAVHEHEVAATCTTAGSYDEVVYCTVCQAELSRTAQTIPAHGHDWSEPVFTWAADYKTATATMTCSRDASHTETASAAVTAADGTGTDEGYLVFTATVVFDGETFTDVQKGYCSPKYSATVTMNENFNLNLYVREVPEELASWFTVKWTFDGGSFEQDLSELMPQAGGQYPGSFKVTLANVYSYQMTKPFVIKVYRNGTDAPVKEITYSVQQYFENQYNKTSDALFKKIYGAALDYGAAAQLYFNGMDNPSTGQPYDTDAGNLANKNTNAAFTINATKPTNKASKSGSITGMDDKMTATLIFGSETSIKIYFKYSGDINDLSITADNGKTVTAPELGSDGRYSVKIEGIRSFELYKDFTFTFTAGTGANAQTRTVTYSPYTYAASKWDNSNADLARLVKALVAYGELARQKWQ